MKILLFSSMRHILSYQILKKFRETRIVLELLAGRYILYLTLEGFVLISETVDPVRLK
jgi:hypothetical protein